MSVDMWIGLGGVVLARFFFLLGAMLRYRKAYWMVAGYNTASPEEKAKYDIEGLGNHLGNGLMTLSVLLVPATIATLLESVVWMWVFWGLFMATTLLIIIGGQKFAPRNQHPAPGRPRHGKHRFLKMILPEGAYRAIREGTRHWLIECPCGHKQDFWDAGGIRYKGAGEPRQLYPCPTCGKARWHKIRKKKPDELGGPGKPPPA
jgi:hypothetical protein